MPTELQLDIIVVVALWLTLVVLLFCTLTGRIKARHPLLQVSITLALVVLSYPILKLSRACLRWHVDCVPDSIVPDYMIRVAIRSLRSFLRLLHMRS